MNDERAAEQHGRWIDAFFQTRCRDVGLDPLVAMAAPLDMLELCWSDRRGNQNKSNGCAKAVNGGSRGWQHSK